MDGNHRLLEHERLQMERIRELDMEELEIEEVDVDFDSSSDDDDDGIPSERGDGGAGQYGGFTFDTCLASLHTYLGEVDATQGRMIFLDGGAIFTLPMFYLEGVVLFPEATLPLRVVQRRFKAAVERALNQTDAPYTIGVVRVYRSSDGLRLCCPTIGTTAEIRQYRRLDDGSLNVVARGQQRFRIRRRWIDVEGTPCAEVQIIQEDVPLRIPKDAFGQLAAVYNWSKCTPSHAESSSVSLSKRQGFEDAESDWECMSATSTFSDSSTMDTRTPTDSPCRYERFDALSSSDEDSMPGHASRLRESYLNKLGGSGQSHDRLSENDSMKSDLAGALPSGRVPIKSAGSFVPTRLKWSHKAPMAFWPHWVYQMYDSYALAQKAADLWKQIIRMPSMDNLVTKPDLLSFHMASKLPMSEATRQELLEIDGVSYRLRREIQLLKSFDLIRCKTCQSVIARRSDMLVMSSDGPLNAYVNPHGFVHEVITVYNANGLALQGRPDKAHSWFPGYAWTITYCASCESNIGWLFTARKKNLLPRSFWGIRSSQVKDSEC
ncbi:uncharacterized protein LOC120251613 [Dioscorea cayenensis subsp. rotundata]|uniref:Protein cereblon n=1 Tax=Dioscorea cayennensis subsp. rotundata TaxID=55577 RepID=A0AB40AMY2_DIOCR|nr:uncharacterized protein LOC120251613 [Dioscorea cayenensis subsp. rotundata]